MNIEKRLITFSEIREKTNISLEEFQTWKAYGLLPKFEKKISLGRGKGFEYFYSDIVIDLIFRIRSLRSSGFSFKRIKKIIKEYLRTGRTPQEVIIRQVAISDLNLPEEEGKEISTERLLELWVNKSKKKFKQAIKQARSKLIKNGKTQNIPRLTTLRKRGAFPSRRSKTRNKLGGNKGDNAGGEEDDSNLMLILKGKIVKSRGIGKVSRLSFI